MSGCVKVRDVSENPLAKPEVAKSHSDDPQMETRILENSINKICSLLAVGFGDAGAEVIANNIRSGGDLNPMIPGNKVVAIFGFCDIRNFTDTTEVLQEDIMEFVNTVADIVHTEVRRLLPHIHTTHKDLQLHLQWDDHQMSLHAFGTQHSCCCGAVQIP